MIKHEKVAGARKESFMASRPVIVCDSRNCGCKIAGNPGMDKGFLRERAGSLGWKHDKDEDVDCCPACAGERR